MKDKYEDDIHNVSNERLAEMLKEIARRNDGDDRTTVFEAAKRIEARRFEPRPPFNHEAFE